MSEEDINEIKKCIEICNLQEEYLKFDGKIRTINTPIPFEAMDRMLQELQLKDKVIDVLTEKLEEKSRWMTKLKWKEFAYNEIKLKENKNV